ncbi:hypothetical protein ACWDV7_25090 [Streptomyces sp. NPDC003362]
MQQATATATEQGTATSWPLDTALMRAAYSRMTPSCPPTRSWTL